jgi:hypothetical protein
MSPAEKDSPENSFWQREGGALLRVGIVALVQILLVVSVFYFTGNQAAPDDVPAFRSGIHPTSSQGVK